MSCKLYLIPTLLGNDDFQRSLPDYNIQIVNQIIIFVVENEKSARKFIKTILPQKDQSVLQIHILNKDTSDQEVSELRLPAVADPGSKLVNLAHKKDIQVIPLVGPSSMMLALMASGMNGQRFMFHGYLPIDKFERKKAIQKLEIDSRNNNCTQLFMETPYRNNQLMEDLVKFGQPSTLVCVAANLTMDDEFILTLPLKNWAQKKADFHKKPAIFLLESY